MKIFKGLPPKSADFKSLGGVVSGAAEFFGYSVGISKIIVLILVVVTGIIPGLIIYCIAYLVMPNKKEAIGHNHVVTQADVDREAGLEGVNDGSH